LLQRPSLTVGVGKQERGPELRQPLYCCFTAALLVRYCCREARKSDRASGGVAQKAATLLLLLLLRYFCFTAALLLMPLREVWPRRQPLYCCFYCCVTATLLLLCSSCRVGRCGPEGSLATFLLLYLSFTTHVSSVGGSRSGRGNWIFYSPSQHLASRSQTSSIIIKKKNQKKSSFSSQSVLSDAERIFCDFFFGKTATPRFL
jgi:hypothetical protein